MPKISSAQVLAVTKNAGVRSVSFRFAAIRIPVLRPSAVEVDGLYSAGVRRVVMLVVPPVRMGLRWSHYPSESGGTCD